MGAVWLAVDERLRRPVATKQLVLAGAATDEERLAARILLRSEARLTARVDHPGTMRIYDVAEEAGEPWIVMEALPGRTLEAALCDQGPRSIGQVTGLGLQLLAVLEATHRAGVVHRDVKPSNVQLCGRARVALTDFGIAATTLTAVVDDPPAPFLRAGPLSPVIDGLLAKDPGRRLDTDQARRALHAIQSGGSTRPVHVDAHRPAARKGSCRP